MRASMWSSGLEDHSRKFPTLDREVSGLNLWAILIFLWLESKNGMSTNDSVKKDHKRRRMDTGIKSNLNNTQAFNQRIVNTIVKS